MFARAVNEDATIQAALENVILFQNDCEKGEGIEIAKRYSVRGYPTFIAVNSKGEVTDGWLGYDGPDAWSRDALAAAADTRTQTEKQAAYEAEPTAALARSLANTATTGYDFAGAVTYLRKARELDPANSEDLGKQILTYMAYGASGGAFTFDQIEVEAKPVMAADGVSAADKVELALMLSGIAGQMGDPAQAAPYVKAAMQASEGSDDESVLKSRKRLGVAHALYVEGDKDKALGLYRANLPEGWEESPNRLNQFAWWCFENEVNQEEALELALKGAELAGDDAERANILDTAAELCNQLGNCDEAVAHMERAIELDPEKGYFKDQLVRFQKAAEEKSKG